MSRNRVICGRAFLYIVVMVLQVCHQIRKCKFSLCSGRIGVFLESDTLCWKCNSFMDSSTKGNLHDRKWPIHRALKEVSTWLAGSFFPLPSLSLAFCKIPHTQLGAQRMVLEISRTEKSTAFSFFFFVAFGMACYKYCSTLPVSGQGQVCKW